MKVMYRIESLWGIKSNMNIEIMKMNSNVVFRAGKSTDNLFVMPNSEYLAVSSLVLNCVEMIF